MAVHLFVEGVVQGVGYRAWMQNEARRLGVLGWVRNLNDGRVEAWLEGPAEAVDLLVQAAHDGPRFAEVSRVEARAADDAGIGGFQVRR